MTSARRGRHRGRMIPVLVACFYAGGVAGWWLHGAFSKNSTWPVAVAPAAVRPAARPHDALDAAPGGAEPAPRPTSDMPIVKTDAIAELRRQRPQLPIDGADVRALEGDFAERRGRRSHEAVDILAARHTPVRAVADGTIARLFFSKAGGTTIYQFDSTERFVYYYAHLQRYAEGLREQQAVSTGEVIGYVGTSGNAPANTPHLHFAIFELTGARRWWEGRPIDPYLVFRRRNGPRSRSGGARPGGRGRRPARP